MSGLPTFRVVGGRKVLVMWPNGADEYRKAIDRVDETEPWAEHDPWGAERFIAQQELDDLRVLELDEAGFDALITALYRAKDELRAQQARQQSGYTIPDRQTSSRD